MIAPWVMTSQELLDLVHGTDIYFGKGLVVNIGRSGRVDDQGAFTAWTQADVQNVLHGATGAFRLTSDQQLAAERANGWDVLDWWDVRGTLPGVGNVGLYVQIREGEKTVYVQDFFSLRAS
jgi:hypothetical protein